TGPLCRRHHRVKHNGWTKRRARDNSVRWTSPAGRTWTSPSPHQPSQPAVRPLPALPAPAGSLDELSPTALDEQLWHRDPDSPVWDDPAAHELRAEDREPDDNEPVADLWRDTRWTLDLDDAYTWHVEPDGHQR
ncbi:MAG: hypothetical protein M3445_11875, partial [Actinomycetota bacterium]|nr:hypothetical protein [Actinomycetota bacterium]